MTSGSHDKKRKSGGGGGGGPKKSGGNIGACFACLVVVGVSSICAALSRVLSCECIMLVHLLWCAMMGREHGPPTPNNI